MSSLNQDLPKPKNASSDLSLEVRRDGGRGGDGGEEGCRGEGDGRRLSLSIKGVNNIFLIVSLKYCVLVKFDFEEKKAILFFFFF